MDQDSEELRAAMRAAEAAIRAAIGKMDPRKSADAPAIKDLEMAFSIVLGRRRELEGGIWPGRIVGAYPVPRERIFDGT